MYCSMLFVVVFQERNCLHIFKHDIVRQVTELHLSTKFSAAVSELCESNQNKEEKLKSAISNLTPFLGI